METGMDTTNYPTSEETFLETTNYPTSMETDMDTTNYPTSMETFIATTTFYTGECCKFKTVGIHNYTLVDPNGNTVGTDCLDTCVYQMIGSTNPDIFFCFKLGFNQVECHDRNGQLTI
eukprot:GFUD01094168.1.p1 GENE.GFUD01094168.1~~GFUD01094168.1.p1  ORF type:complete len:134 (-),score=27.52 GFUD01094168.1:50-403(-)